MVVSDLVLAISAGYSLYHCGGSKHINWEIATYGLCFTHGLLGVINSLNGENSLQKIKDYTLTVVTIIPLPFMATHIYIENSMDRNISLIHAVSGILPLVTDLLDNNSANVRDLVFIGNAASLTFLGIQQEKPWYIALTVMGALNHFYTRKMGEKMEITPDQALSVGLGIFCLLASLKV